MRKILFSLLAISTVSAMASHMSMGPYQNFDNQYNLGYGWDQASLLNGGGKSANVTNQVINMEVQRLFDVGVWMTVNAYMNISSASTQTVGIGSTPFLNQYPYLGGMNAKVGYGFNAVRNHLLITPYAVLGRNLNVAASTIVYNSGANIASNDYYITTGIGGQLEYRINCYIDLFLDQTAVYNWDQSGPNVGAKNPQNLYSFKTTIGAKFNIVKNLQLGAKVFGEFYSYNAAAPADTTGTSIFQPQNDLGGLITIGLTY
jgi:hypothetical protein